LPSTPHRRPPHPDLGFWLPPLPSFIFHSPDLLAHTLPGVSSLAPSSVTFSGLWPLTSFVHPTLAPILPSPPQSELIRSTSVWAETSTAPTESARTKRKHEEQPASTRGGGQTGTVQVVKWKLNSPRYKRSKVESATGECEWKRCEHCGTDSTPEWRTGPLGKGTLCNACGLRYRSKLREQKKHDTSGSIPMSLLLNPVSAKKGRASINNPMIWETKVSAATSSFRVADLLS
jgi:hypothetical protein